MKTALQIVRSNSSISIDVFKAFVTEFISWKDSVVSKSYSDDYLIGTVYKENVIFKTRNEYTQLCKAQVSLASITLKDLLVEIENTDLTCESASKHITEYVFDLKPFVEELERRNNPNYNFFEGGKSTSDMAVMMFKEAKTLFWSSIYKDVNPVSHRSALNLSVFALRQALEIRLRRAIGIYKILDEKLNNAKLSHDFYIDFFKNNTDIFTLKIPSITNLSKIYKWTNYSIHTGFMARVWEIQYAFDYCSNLFNPDSYEHGKGWSIHSAIKISDYAELKKRFENKVKIMYPNSSWDFTYMESPEAVTS